MHFHCKPLALDKVLARMMEVELLERVSALDCLTAWRTVSPRKKYFFLVQN